MNKTEELYHMFRQNFPEIIRDEKTAKNILSNEHCHIIEKRNEYNELTAVSVIHQNTILMLCVNEEYRNSGIGSGLLEESEHYIKDAGYDSVNIGAGFEYLMPGVPITGETEQFMKKRGYTHSWGDAECFDMAVNLEDCDIAPGVNDEIDGIVYRFAVIEDVDGVKECVADAEEEFVQYYMETDLYKENGCERVLVAVDGDEVCGAVIVGIETEAKETGSIACTSTKGNHQHRGIATNMVRTAVGYFKESGMKYGFLGYTYTGLEKLYGAGGYRITNRYMMAAKPLQSSQALQTEKSPEERR